VLTTGGALVSDLGDAIARDPEVRQARMIAEAARTRLVACVSAPEDGIDLAEAQGMLDALRNAWALAADAEDRVLLHRGLLASAEAHRRAEKRRPALPWSREPARPAARRGWHPVRRIAALLAALLAAVLAGAVSVAVARRCGVTPRPTRP
jgi:hypothetical protein